MLGVCICMQKASVCIIALVQMNIHATKGRVAFIPQVFPFSFLHVIGQIIA